jgi:hypothetical protein
MLEVILECVRRGLGVAGLRSVLREGKAIGLPLCCRWRYALTEAVRPGAEQAIERGVSRTDAGMEYVPCRILHAPTVFSTIVYESGEPVLYIETAERC